MAQYDCAEVFKRGDPIPILAMCMHNLSTIKPDQRYRNAFMPKQIQQSGEVWTRFSDQYLQHHRNTNPNELIEFRKRQQLFLTRLNAELLSELIRQHELQMAIYAAEEAAYYRRKAQKKRAKKYVNKNQKAVLNTGYTVFTNRFNISQSELVENLRRYIIAPHLLRKYGFPVESAVHDGKIVIYKKLPRTHEKAHNTDDNVDPVELERKLVVNKEVRKKQCIRCGRTFSVKSSGVYVSRERCTFHWGKLYTVRASVQYTCCAGFRGSVGCTTNQLHVWTGAVPGINGPYADFVHTRELSNEPKVYALDCEMSFTGRGLAATKVTVIDYDGKLVYEHFVRPISEIVDYNTRFSGVTERDVSKYYNKKVKTLGEVQRDLLQIIDANTILIGHGLENDLRVLRICHKLVVDTSIVFPHFDGFPNRQSLKYLTKTYLNRDIQLHGQSHNSLEDTRACLELILWKVSTDMPRSKEKNTCDG